MRYLFIVLLMLLGSMTSALAQVSIGIGLPGMSIGINLPVFPELVPIPGYPVYYAPRLDSNYFFYDGLYWVYQGDNWYASSWYNGPWGLVAPEAVPLFILRIPVRYYRLAPAYFHGWRPDAPPRWGEHWGNDWEQHRRGWDKWQHSAAPARAPLPVYQRQYSGARYPQAQQQPALHGQNYRYQPHDAIVRQHYQEQAVQRAPAPPARGQQVAPVVPHAPPPQLRGERGGEEVHRAAPMQVPPAPTGPAVEEPRRQPPPGREKEREKDEERGHERNR